MRKISKGINLVSVIAIVIILFGPLHISLKVNSIFASLFAVIVIYSRSLDVLPDFLIKKLEWVGDRSYSIYLVHMPLLYLAKYSPMTQIGNGENRIIQSTIATVASIVFGACSYSMVENRFRNREKININNLKNITVTLVLTLLFPLTLFLAGVNSRLDLDPNLPIPSKPLPWEWDSTCQVMGSTSEIERACVYGNQESANTILLIGDSHAASNSRAVIKVAQSNDLKVSVFTQSLCPFIFVKNDLSATFKLPGLGTYCMGHNQAILDYINIQKPIITILSMRSTSAYILPNTASSRMLYRKTILNSLSKLSQSKTNFILIGAEPEYKATSSWLAKILGMKGGFSEVPLEDSRWWSDVSLSNFYYINTFKIFCPQNECKNKVGSIWLFNDEHHLSKEGAEMLLPELNQLVDEILKRNS